MTRDALHWRYLPAEGIYRIWFQIAWADRPPYLTGRTATIGNERMENSQSGPAVSGVVVTTMQVPRLAVAAYLARFKGQSRIHTESDLRSYLDWLLGTRTRSAGR
jgi:hypothetical protein